MRWGYLFSKTICERGRRYYANGEVTNLTVSGTQYSARVKGSSNYNVVIDLKNSDSPKMRCNCPYAADGNRCKHMAAVLYEIEDKMKASAPKSEKRVYPFKRKNDADEYRYFDLEQITSKLIISEKLYEDAKNILDDGGVEITSVDYGYSDGIDNGQLICFARGIYKQGRTQGIISITFDRENIVSSYCQVPRCYMNYNSIYTSTKETKPCVHMTAFLLLLDKYLLENDTYDSTDYNALRLMRTYRSNNALEASEKLGAVSSVTLEPRVENFSDSLMLSFMIGTDKLYVVKNLSELVDIVDNKKTLALGKKAEVDFGVCSFTESSRKYYDFIRRNVLEELQRKENIRYSYRSYMYSSEEIKGSINLYGGRLDDFFELAEGSSVYCVDKSGRDTEKRNITLRKNKPNLSLVIKKDVDERKVFHGVIVSGEVPMMIQGVKARYYIEGNYFNKVDKESLKELEPVLGLANGKLILFHVGRRHLSEFYYRVLPALQECAQIEEKDAQEIEKYIPPEVSFLFYMDAEENCISCRPCAVYGEKSCMLTDWLEGGVRREDFRDELREKEALGCVQEYFDNLDAKTGVFFSGNDADSVYRVLEQAVPRLMQFGEIRGTDSFRRLKIRRRFKVSVGVAIKSDMLDLQIASEDLSSGELLEILNSYRKKKKFYRMRNGDFLSLEDESLGELNAMLETMRIPVKEFVKGKMQMPLYRALYLDKMLENSQEIYAKRDSTFKNLVKSFKTVSDSDFELPDALTDTMRGYQVYGYKWLKTLENYGFGGILADDMGLGKTLQAISVLLAAKLGDEKENAPSLVVAPASLVYNWYEECRRFAPQLSVCTIAGSSAERRDRLADYQKYDVLVTSYDLLKRDIAEYEDKEFSYQIIDEAQYIKNHTTAAAKAVKLIKSRHRFALTGTPIENRLSELWSIFDYLMPGFLYGYEAFKKELETPIVKNKDADATKRLKRMVSPFILRRIKADVLKDLPDKMEEVRYAKLSEEQQRLYDGQVVHMRELLDKQNEENFQKSKLQVLAELTKLRQICCDPSLLFEDYNGESAKRESCIELIHSAIEGEHKILLFSQFTSMLELLEKDLQAEKIAYYKITGATPKEKRTQMVKRFNEDDTPLFLISLKAGGTGLNLTGADIVIHYDPWWNLAVQNQATDRAHRIGQTKVVSVYRLIVKGSIEEKILHMQETKKNLADEILSGEMGGIMNMSREELMELIE